MIDYPLDQVQGATYFSESTFVSDTIIFRVHDYTILYSPSDLTNTPSIFIKPINHIYYPFFDKFIIIASSTQLFLTSNSRCKPILCKFVITP